MACSVRKIQDGKMTCYRMPISMESIIALFVKGMVHIQSPHYVQAIWSPHRADLSTCAWQLGPVHEKIKPTGGGQRIYIIRIMRVNV